MMDIVERSQKAQEAINRMIGENSILKVINENQSKEIERLREEIQEYDDMMREVAEYLIGDGEKKVASDMLLNFVFEKDKAWALKEGE